MLSITQRLTLLECDMHNMFQRPWGVNTIHYSSTIVFILLLRVPPHPPLIQTAVLLIYFHFQVKGQMNCVRDTSTSTRHRHRKKQTEILVGFCRNSTFMTMSELTARWLRMVWSSESPSWTSSSRPTISPSPPKRDILEKASKSTS